MSVKINTLEIENVKRIKAVKMQCTEKALTVIGGNNGQGKTSILDAIAYALGGEKYRPSNVQRDGSLANPEIKITLSNGLMVERKGKNSSLKVTDTEGRTGGQQLLNKFIHQFALDLPRFLNATTKEKANILLQIIGVGDKLAELDLEEQRKYNERHAFGRVADQKKKYAEELPTYADAPDVPVSAMELIQEQQEILAKNGENQRKRQELARIQQEHDQAWRDVERIRQELKEAEARCNQLIKSLEIAQKTAAQLQDESTAEIEKRLRSIDEVNVKVRANLDKAKALEDAQDHDYKYNLLTMELDDVRKKKNDLLESADLPLPGLTVEKGELLYNGQAWDCMAGSEQLRVSTAIIRKLNPECGFVLLDKLEQMDLATMNQFGKWLEQEGLQAIATRVSNGDECSIIIEDGYSTGSEETKPNYVPGDF